MRYDVSCSRFIAHDFQFDSYDSSVGTYDFMFRAYDSASVLVPVIQCLWFQYQLLFISVPMTSALVPTIYDFSTCDPRFCTYDFKFSTYDLRFSTCDSRLKTQYLWL